MNPLKMILVPSLALSLVACDASNEQIGFLKERRVSLQGGCRQKYRQSEERNPKSHDDFHSMCVTTITFELV